MNPNNNFSNNNKNNNKMPKFNMGWIYGLCIIGLIIAFIMGGNSTGSWRCSMAVWTNWKALSTQPVRRAYSRAD